MSDIRRRYQLLSAFILIFITVVILVHPDSKRLDMETIELMSVKFDGTNYAVWKIFIQFFVEGKSLLGLY